MNEKEYILVWAPAPAGKDFIRRLQHKNLTFIALAETEEERNDLVKLGVEHIICMDNAEHETGPELLIGNVYMFDHYLPLCCRYLQRIRKWTSATVYVITEEDNGWSVYKRFGADYVIHSKTGNVDFLIR